MRLLVTRPRAESESFAQALAARGIESLIEPMIEIVDLPGPPVAADHIQAVLFTSVNGVRALQRRNQNDLAAFAPVAVLAVGDATARAARAAGLPQAGSAAGDVASLAALAAARLTPRAGPLLHIAGSRVAGDLAGRLQGAGFEVRRMAIYEARPAARLSAETQAALRCGRIDGVTFFSPRTAAAFVTLCDKAGVAPLLAPLTAVCLSPAVAQAARGASWRSILVAARPDQESLLACLREPGLRPISQTERRSTESRGNDCDP